MKRICFLFLFLHLMVREITSQSLGTNDLFPDIPQEVINIQTQRVGFSAVVVDSYVYVFGGFFHANQGGDPVDNVDIYSVVSGELLYNSSLPPMPTPRGFMAAVLFNETLIITIGGTVSTATNEGMTVVEALSLEPLDPSKGKWVPWSNLRVPRSNPTATVASGVVVVALGSENSSSIVEWLTEYEQENLPSLPRNVAKGILGTLDDNGSLLLFCLDVNPTETLLLTNTNTWKSLQETPLTPWTIDSIFQVSSSIPFFLANTIEHSSFLFLLEDGNMTEYICYLGLECSGLPFFVNQTALCLTSSETFQVTIRTPRTNGPPLPPLGQPQWGTFQGDLQRTGRGYGNWTCYPAFGSFVAIKWTVPTVSQVFTPVVGIDGAVYFGQKDGYFDVLSPTGSVIWDYAMAGGKPQEGTPTVIGSNGVDVIYLGSALEGVYCFTENKLLWRQPSGLGVFFSSPAVLDGYIFVPGNDEMYCLSAATGEYCWTPGQNSIGNCAASPAIDPNGIIYITTEEYNLYSFFFDGETGPHGDKYFGYSRYASPVVLSDGSILLVANSGYVEVWYSNMTSRWTSVQLGFIQVTPAISWDEQTFYISTGNGLTALNATNGLIEWRFESNNLLNFSVDTSPVVASDGTIFVALGSVLFALNPEGLTMWSYDFQELITSSLAISYDGTVYFGVGAGLVALNGNAADGVWLSFSLLDSPKDLLNASTVKCSHGGNETNSEISIPDQSAKGSLNHKPGVFM